MIGKPSLMHRTFGEFWLVGKLCNGFDNVEALAGEAQMNRATPRSIALCLSVSVSLVLMFDILLSMYKLIEYREAILVGVDYGIVVFIYAAALVSASLTLAAASISILSKQSSVIVFILLLCGSLFAAMLALANFLSLPQWPATALENKIPSLICCLLINTLIFGCVRQTFAAGGRIHS